MTEQGSRGSLAAEARLRNITLSLSETATKISKSKIVIASKVRNDFMPASSYFIKFIISQKW